jgi:hypothetical protein
MVVFRVIISGHDHFQVKVQLVFSLVMPCCTSDMPRVITDCGGICPFEEGLNVPACSISLVG